MSRWWKGIVLVAAWLGLCGMGRAQYKSETSPVGAARMPEPIPTGESKDDKPVPDLIPGPISPFAAPPGPGPDLSLNPNVPSAFQCEPFPFEQAFYASIGGQVLQRQGLGHGLAATFDSPGTPVAQTLDARNPGPGYGMRGTIGYLDNDQAVELTAFGIFDNPRASQITRPGQLDLPFTNAPAGFQGSFNPWTRADSSRISQSTSLASAELNYRRWNGGVNGFDFLAGLRYMYLRDHLSSTAANDLTTVGVPDPAHQATYSATTANNICAFQLGAEYMSPLPTKYLDMFSFGIMGKAAVGPNFVSTTTDLTRGDGLIGFHNSKSSVNIGQIYEASAFLEYQCLDRARIRAGYMALWVSGLTTAADTFDFNLANTAGRENKNGGIFFHGPMFELMFLF